MRQYVYGAIGIAAFVFGGIITRKAALENAQTVEEFFTKKSSDEQSDEN